MDLSKIDVRNVVCIVRVLDLSSSPFDRLEFEDLSLSVARRSFGLMRELRNLRRMRDSLDCSCSRDIRVPAIVEACQGTSRLECIVRDESLVTGHCVWREGEEEESEKSPYREP